MGKKGFVLVILMFILVYPISLVASQESTGDLFLEKCAPCHGPQGKGDGPAAIALNPKPRDFTSGQWKLGGSKEQIIKTITEGIPGTAMQAWKEFLSPAQIGQMAAYVLTFSQKAR